MKGFPSEEGDGVLLFVDAVEELSFVGDGDLLFEASDSLAFLCSTGLGDLLMLLWTGDGVLRNRWSSFLSVVWLIEDAVGDGDLPVEDSVGDIRTGEGGLASAWTGWSTLF